MKYIATVLLIVCVGCGVDTSFRRISPTQNRNAPLSRGDLLAIDVPFGLHAAITSLGIDQPITFARRVGGATTWFDVEVPSHRPGVADLKMTFSLVLVGTNEIWNLQTPTREKVDKWVKNSGPE